MCSGLRVGFIEAMYSVTEGESVEVCAALLSPGTNSTIGTTEIYLDVVADNTFIPDNATEAS